MNFKRPPQELVVVYGTEGLIPEAGSLILAYRNVDVLYFK